MTAAYPQRGEIYWGDSTATGMKKERPLLIVQNDLANKYSPYTILVPIHHDETKILPVMVPIPRGIAGLTKDSLVDCGHVATLEKTALRKRIGVLPRQYMDLVDLALMKSLSLIPAKR